MAHGVFVLSTPHAEKHPKKRQKKGQGENDFGFFVKQFFVKMVL
jgi:hypothetical protein